MRKVLAAVVVALGVAMGATLVMPRKIRCYGRSPSDKVERDLAGIEGLLLDHVAAHEGRWPADLGAVFPGRRILDPWRREYGYFPPCGSDPRAVVFTLGRDGAPGGLGEDADVARAFP